MDRLKTMGAFVLVVRRGSFTSAARQLGVSGALVSRYIADLEAHVGVRLLDRSTRSLHVTEAGEAYCEFCEEMFREIEARQQSLRDIGSAPRGSLKIVAPKTFGALVLADAIIAFARSNPQLNVTLTLEDLLERAPYFFMEKGFDIALRMAAISDSRLIARELCSLQWVVCASPEYLRRVGRPKQPAELAKHECLVQANLSANDRIWKFGIPTKSRSVKVGGRFQSNSTLVLRKAAKAGMGIALLPKYCAASDLLKGTLIELFNGHPACPRPLFGIYMKNKGVPVSQKVKVFIAFLIMWFKENDPNLSCPTL